MLKPWQTRRGTNLRGESVSPHASSSHAQSSNPIVSGRQPDGNVGRRKMRSLPEADLERIGALEGEAAFEAEQAAKHSRWLNEATTEPMILLPFAEPDEPASPTMSAMRDPCEVAVANSGERAGGGGG